MDEDNDMHLLDLSDGPETYDTASAPPPLAPPSHAGATAQPESQTTAPQATTVTPATATAPSGAAPEGTPPRVTFLPPSDEKLVPTPTPPTWQLMTEYSPRGEVLKGERTIGERAIKQWLPAWQLRINALFRQAVPLRVNIEECLGHCTTPQARLKTIKAMFSQTAVSQPAALEILVRTLERRCRDDDVKASMLGVMQEIRIVNQPGGQKGLWLDNMALVYAAPFESGYLKSVLSVAYIEKFLESSFYAEERRLVNIFNSRTLPGAQMVLSKCFGHETPVHFDILGMLGRLEDPSNRLFTTQTIVQETGLAKAGAVLSDRTNEFADAASSAIEKLFTGKSTVVAAPKYAERTDSPQVLLPLQAILEAVVRRDPTNVDILGSAIKEVHFEMVPPAMSYRCGLELRRSLTEQPLKPADLAVQDPPKDLFLVYVGAFELGAKGCLNHEKVQEFLEQFFRITERTLMTSFTETYIPQFTATLTDLLDKPVQVEVDWPSIFHAGVTSNARLGVAKVLGQQSSRFTLLPLSAAFSDVVNKDQTGRAKMTLAEKMTKVVIAGVPGTSARPMLVKHEDGKLVYACALEAGALGTLPKETLKELIRNVYDLPVPPEDGGVAAAARKMGEGVTRFGDAMLEKLSAWKF